MTRADVLTNFRNAAKSDTDAERAFLTAMVWGHGRVGYGAYRTERVLAENPNAARRLREVAAVAKKQGGVAAFRHLASDRLDGLGVAFGTKYLFFCAEAGVSPAPILDRLVRGWLGAETGWWPRMDWNVMAYERYVGTLEAWGTELELAVADVELLIFQLAVAKDPTSQWAAAPQASDGGLAVLEALDQAQEAFAALPGESDPDDDADFQSAMRAARRAVLARKMS